MYKDGTYKGLSVRIAIKRIKRMHLRVVADEPNVRLSAPPTVTSDEIFKMIDDNLEWIRQALVKVKTQASICSEAEPPLARQQAVAFAMLVHLKLRYWAGIMKVNYTDVSIRTMKSRWGSCTSNGRICINRRLAHYPEQWLDYVVVHELAHRRHMNHSPEFWAVVEKYCPDWKKIRSAMRGRIADPEE